MTASELTWRKLWTKIGLTQDLCKSVVKNTLPSTAALWVIQSTTLGQQFDTVGYLPIIVTILLTPNLPRIPYLRLLIFTLFLICVVLCLSLLAGYCATQARLHTTPPNGSLDAYNSSAAAVSGVWLVFMIWGLQTFRTFKPHRAKCVVLGTIFTEVSIITSSKLSDMASVTSFNIQLFEMFLLGFAFSAFSSLFIFPQSSRGVTRVDVINMFNLAEKATSMKQPFGEVTDGLVSASEDTAASHVVALSRIFAKFQIDISDAKKDIGWSIFSVGDLKDIVHHMRILIMPLRGLFAVESIRQTLRFGKAATGYDKKNVLPESDDNDPEERWNLIFEKLQEPMSQLHQLTTEAIGHCRIALHLPGSDKPANTVRRNSENAEDGDTEKMPRELPGGSRFIADFEKQVRLSQNSIRLVVNQLKDQDGRLGSVGDFCKIDTLSQPHSPTAAQARLLFALYIEYLYNGVLEALLDLVLLCDKHTTSKSKLQLPGKKRMLKLIRRLIDHHHVEGDLDDIASEIPNLKPTMTRMSEPPKKRTRWLDLEQVTAWLDKPFEIVGSPQSFFGLRVACAVITIAVVGFLSQTQQWFFNRRGLWATVFIPFSMAPSSGEAKSMLTYRVLGTICSIPLAIVNWYIVDGVPAGVIVFYCIFVLIQQYFLIKFPQWGSFWRPCVITYSIIVGYTLQAKHTHVPQPPATTTQDFPVYLIGPYRGICTLIGVGVAYFWTVFPRPMTASTVMRQRLGQTLFVLAEHHSCMHWAISSWAGGHQGDVKDKKSVAYRLMKARQKSFVKETALLTVIRDQHKFARYDMTLVGHSIEDRYMTIADEVDRIMTYMNVVIFVAAHYHSYLHTLSRGSKVIGPWETGVDDLLIAAKSTSREVASLIHILASSVTNNQPLPPFLEPPEIFTVARKMRELRPDLMDIQHADEEGYKAFAVIEVSVAMMTKSLDRMLHLVRDMVGEVGVDIGWTKYS